MGFAGLAPAREECRPADGVREDRLRQDRSGRLPDLLDDWSVRRLKEAGADCIKILLYYTPFDSKAINNKSTRGSSASATNAARTTSRSFWSSSGTKRASTRRARVRAQEAGDRDRSPWPSSRRTVRRGRDEGRSAREHEVRRGRASSGGGASLHARSREAFFLESAKVATKPFIYLSAGVSNAEFTESLALAASPACVLRSAVRPRDLEGRHSRLRQAGRRCASEVARGQGVQNIKNVNTAIQSAVPWYSFYGVKERGLAATLEQPLTVHCQPVTCE
jgi:tagatose 1,6-diphosphate aldolase